MKHVESVEDRLASEVVRKLHLATEAETKEDREIICEEVFSDITGIVDAHAKLHVQLASSSDEPVAYFQVLARHYNERAGDRAVALVYVLQKLWGQGSAAPIFALLLHRWLLMHRSTSVGPDSNGRSSFTAVGSLSQITDDKKKQQRLKLINVLVLGAKQLFLGDVNSGQMRFSPLYRFMADEVVMGPRFMTVVAPLPLALRSSMLAAVAAVLPYYAVQPEDVPALLEKFPPPTQVTPSHMSMNGIMSAGQILSWGHSPSVSGHKGGTEPPSSSTWAQPGAGAEFLISETIDTMRQIRSESPLLRYLRALSTLAGSQYLAACSPTTKLRLQSELYALSSPGGPHYAPRSVRKAANDTLDKVFPMGKSTRRLVRMLFRLLHPTDWLGEFWLAPLRWWAYIYGQAIVLIFRVLHKIIRMWGGRGNKRQQEQYPLLDSETQKQRKSTRPEPIME